MMKNKTLLISIVIVLFVAGIFFATKKKPLPQSAGEGTAGTNTQQMRVVILTSPSGVDDGSFNQDNYEGILAYIKKHPNATVKAIQEPTGDPAAAMKAVSDVVADYDVIVTPGFQFAGVSKLALENPDKKFVLIDVHPEKVGYQEAFDNLYAARFAEQEGGFLAGVAAALETKTGKVAMVGGVAYPPVVNYQFGFAAGVNYANKALGTKVQQVEIPSYAGTDVRNVNVGGNYVGSFNDEPTGKVVGNALLKEGVDVIFVAAGNSGNGVFTAVKEAKDAKVIGCDIDQYNDGVSGNKNVVLTSVVKRMGLNVERVLDSITDGSFKGGNHVLGADSDSTNFIQADGRQQLSEKTIKQLGDVYKMIQEKKVVPPSNFSESTPKNFEGLPK